jgi:RND family efflux transporter MFP subunit
MFATSGYRVGMRRTAAATLFALGGPGFAFGQAAPNAPPPPVAAAKPIVKEIVEQDDFIGRFEAVDTVDLRARVSGYLDKIHFQDGAIVKAGDPLFTIDQRPYIAALQEAQATVASAKAREDFTQTDLERAENLRRSGNIAEQVFDQRRQTLLTARAELDRATAALNRAQLDMEFTVVKAPVSGRISRRLVSIGNLVNANETLLSTVVSIDPIQFYFDVDERSFLAYAQAFGRGNGNENGSAPVSVMLTNEREPRRTGRIDFLDVRLDPSSGTMRARALFENKDLSLTPGLFGRIRIPGSRPYKGVLVPDEAVSNDQDRRVLYVVADDGTVSQRTVRPGPRIDGYRVIRTGLDGSETVVIAGLQRARPGSKVSPKLEQLPPSRDDPSRDRNSQ